MERNDAIEWAIQQVAFEQKASTTENVWKHVKSPLNPYPQKKTLVAAAVGDYLRACAKGEVTGREGGHI